MNGEDHQSAKDIFEDSPDWYQASELSDEELDANFVPPKRQMENGLGIAPNARRVAEVPDSAYRLKSPGNYHWYATPHIFANARLMFLLMPTLAAVFLYGYLTDSVVNVEQGECVTSSSQASEEFGAPLSDSSAVSSPDRVLVVPCDQPNFGLVTAVVDVPPLDDPDANASYWDRVRESCEQESERSTLNEEESLVLLIGHDWQRDRGDYRTLCVLRSPQEVTQETWSEQFAGFRCVTIEQDQQNEPTWVGVPRCGLGNGQFTPNSAYLSASFEPDLVDYPVRGGAARIELLATCKAEIIGRIEGFPGDLESMEYEILVPPEGLWADGTRLIFCAIRSGQGFAVSGA